MAGVRLHQVSCVMAETQGEHQVLSCGGGGGAAAAAVPAPTSHYENPAEAGVFHPDPSRGCSIILSDHNHFLLLKTPSGRQALTPARLSAEEKLVLAC